MELEKMIDTVRSMVRDVRTPGPAREAAIVAGAVVAALAVAAALRINGPSEVGLSLGMLILGVAAALWFLPALVAYRRKHHQLGLVVFLCALAIVPVIGWVTWIVALIVAAVAPAQPAAVAGPPGWRPGDVANGHILSTDGRWLPIERPLEGL